MNTAENTPSMLISDPGYPRLKNYLIDISGLAYYSDKDPDLADRIGRRLNIVGLNDCASYLDLLMGGQSGELELDAILAELTIGETHFFRHSEQFEALRTIVLPDIIQKNQSTQRIRIWSAGCSIGAEPYTVAILLKRDFGHRLLNWDVSIVGTDINRNFLAAAREGRFDDWAFRSTPEEIKRSCFSRSGQHWMLLPEYKDRVTFQYHNLVRNPYPSLLNNLSSFDLILCRNVMIYFKREIVKKIILQLEQSLGDGGWLLVGHAEPNIEFFKSFRTINVPGATLYQKSPEPSETSALPRTDLWAAPELPSFPALEPSQPSSVNEAANPVPSIPETPPADTLPLETADSELAMVRALADCGEWDKARTLCERVLKKESLRPAIHFTHALILEQLGMHEETEQALRRAIYLDRNYVLAHYYLGLLHQKLWNAAGAVQSFENALRLLSNINANQTFPDADGINAGALAELTEMHLDILRGV